MRTNRALSRILAASFCILLAFSMLLALAQAIWPEATGKKTKQDGLLYVDYGHVDQGYFMAKAAKKGNKKLKLRVKCGDNTVTYDLDNSGAFETFPLQFGSGSYKLMLYKQVSGNKYSDEGSITLKAELANENSAFLCPNQYVNYTADSPAVLEAEKLCTGLGSDREKFRAICDYVKKSGFSYDFVKAVQVKSGTMPDIETCFKKKKGICQDLSAMVVAMLRAQEIPAKLVIGYADKNYHAWVVAYIDGEQVLYDPTAVLNAISKVNTYTVERFY